MNIITATVISRGRAPEGWRRAEWTARGVEWHIDYDITILLANIAVAGALSRAWRLGGNPAGWGPNVKGKAAP